MVPVSATAQPLAGAQPCLHDLFEQQAQLTPNAVALVCEEQWLTYRDLARRSDLLAHRLRALGALPDEPVALLVERSLDTVVGILGILKAGAAYLPMDPALPRARVAFVLQDAGVQQVLTQSALLPVLPAGFAQAICLDAFDWDAPPAPARAARRSRPEDLAYVIYTSGSTGRPKGVCVEHRNIVNYVLGMALRLRLAPGMQHATVSTIAADLGNTVIFPALATGGSLHVISRERAEDPALLAEYFSREKIDVLKIVPSHLAALQAGRNPGGVMPRMRLVLGGEASRLDWVEHLRALAPACEILNHYGPTETTVGVLTYLVGAQLPATPSGTLPLGAALPNCRVYVLDAAGRPVAAGERGELCVGGGGVARGYLNRPELTAEKFIADPFSAEPGARMYRTGDRARCAADGNFEFLGRIDDQIKLHGYRIEPGEIEAALREHGGVRDAVVLAHEEASGASRLTAYVAPKRARQPLWACAQVHLLPDGAPVAHLNRNETEYIYNEVFVLQAYLRHGIAVREGDCVVDAGANIGLFTVFANRLAYGLRTFALEPNPAAFACLAANAEAWGEAVKCLPQGLSRENGTAELTCFQGLSLLSGFHADAAVEREVVKSYILNQQRPDQSLDEREAADLGALLDSRLETVTVTAQLRTLSGVMATEGIERIDLLKVNVEKSELDVLLGIDDGDWPRIRQLVVEVDRREDLEPITDLLQRQGYEFLVEQDPLLRNTELCYVYAIRPSPQGRLERQPTGDAPRRLVPAPDPEILAPAVLRHHLKARLPQYMVPSAFVLVEKMPLTANGKIDRRALAAIAVAPAPVTAAPGEAQTQTEKALAALWAELLELDRVGVDDDFFDLGGHSLLAIRAVARVRDKFGVNLSLRNLLEAPTVAGLARVIDGLSLLTRSVSPVQEAGAREEIEL
jgi:amino acid adenylation domain-containing protein/FkbM family methyltransferase